MLLQDRSLEKCREEEGECRKDSAQAYVRKRRGDSAQTHVWRVGDSAVGFCSDSCPSTVMVSDVWREAGLLD